MGSGLVRAAQRWATGQGHTRITLETGAANDVARRLYARLGYREEEVRLTRELPGDAAIPETAPPHAP